jgi:hypothetical protein
LIKHFNFEKKKKKKMLRRFTTFSTATLCSTTLLPHTFFHRSTYASPAFGASETIGQQHELDKIRPHFSLRTGDTFNGAPAQKVQPPHDQAFGQAELMSAPDAEKWRTRSTKGTVRRGVSESDVQSEVEGQVEPENVYKYAAKAGDSPGDTTAEKHWQHPVADSQNIEASRSINSVTQAEQNKEIATAAIWSETAKNYSDDEVTRQAHEHAKMYKRKAPDVFDHEALRHDRGESRDAWTGRATMDSTADASSRDHIDYSRQQKVEAAMRFNPDAVSKKDPGNKWDTNSDVRMDNLQHLSK